MQSILGFDWLIPFLPFSGAMVLLLLLASFNRTMNRLTRPVSYLMMACVSFSTSLSFISFQNDFSGEILDSNLQIASINLHFGLYVDRLSSLTATFGGLIMLLTMILSYNLIRPDLDRPKNGTLKVGILNDDGASKVCFS